MRLTDTRTFRRAPVIGALGFLLAAAPGAAGASDDAADSQASEAESKPDKAVVTPYKTRPAPSHRVSLRDGRVFFLKKLEETDGGFVLHTMEDETIEVEQSEMDEIVQFEKE